MDSFKSIAKNCGAKLTIDLKVSAPFHCKLMEDASIKMNEEINKTSFNQFKVPIIIDEDSFLNITKNSKNGEFM